MLCESPLAYQKNATSALIYSSPLGKFDYKTEYHIPYSIAKQIL